MKQIKIDQIHLEWKIIKNSFIMFIVGLMIAIVSLTAVYCLPTGRMNYNAKDAVGIFKKEASYPMLNQEYKNTQLDNYTDAIMLGIAVYRNNDLSIPQQALMNYRPGEDPYQPVQELSSYLEKHKASSDLKYPRYWHGYLLFLKPALMLFGYGDIRMLNTFLQFALLGYIIYQFAKRQLGKYAIAFGVAAAFLMPLATSQSIQLSTVFYPCMVAIAVMLRFHEWLNERYRYCYLFMILGMCTSFLDLLTYPLVSLGLPLVVWMILHDEEDWKYQLRWIIGFSLIWGLGFGFFWAAKWIITSLIMQENYVGEAIQEITKRTSNEGKLGETLSLKEVLEKNFKVFDNPAYSNLFYATVFGGILFTIKKHIPYRNFLKKLMPYMLISLMPVVWICLTANHSSIHYWFTSRTVAIFVFAWLTFIMSLYKHKKVRRLPYDH